MSTLANSYGPGEVASANLASVLTDHPAGPAAEIVHWNTGATTLASLSESAVMLSELIGQVRHAPVVCLVDRGIDAVIAMFATWLGGGVYVPISAHASDAEVRLCVAEYRPAIVVTGETQAHRIPRACNRAVMFPDGGFEVDLVHGWPGARFSDGSALLMHTSGTAGVAKPVLLQHQGVLDGIDTVIARLRGPAARPCAPMPNVVPTSLALWAGIWNTLFAFRLGAPVVLLDRFDTVRYAEAVRKFQIKSTVLAPAMMTMLTADSRVKDLHPLRFVRSVTGPLVPDQALRFHQRFGVDVLNSYGQTELGGEVAGWTAGDLREHGWKKMGAVGRPHPGVSVRILDDARRPAPVGTAGEICVRSPFWTRQLAAGSDRMVEGHLRTGDVGRFDADGFLWVDGRVTDAIHCGQFCITPRDVEDVLRAHPQIADACVAGVPDERSGEVPVAWVLPAPGCAPEQESVRAFVSERLDPHQVPVAVHLVADDFPRNEIGKVLRRELVARRSA